MNKPQYIIVHTTAFKGDADIDLVRKWHVEGNGWRDVGYHYFIRRSGELQQGRQEHETGAHCRDMGMNSKSIGICFEGHHNYEDWTLQQTKTFLSLGSRIIRKYDIPVKNVLGHRETGAKKDCPGTRINMSDVRRIIQSHLQGTI